MRVISQSGLTDIPYELFTFSVTKDNCICCMKTIAGTADEICASIIAKYTSIEKTKKAMTYMQCAFASGELYFLFPRDSDIA